MTTVPLSTGVSAPGVAAARRYVRRVTLAGRAVDGNFVKSADLRKGGELAFEMSDRCGRGD